MGAYTLTKIGALLPTGSVYKAYYPCPIDTSEIEDWPWTVTVFASDDHSPTGKICAYGAVGDPTDPDNWETYAEALALGRFDAFPVKPATNNFLQWSTNSTETPAITKIGSVWYMTVHVDLGSNNQPTGLATSTDLLTWTWHDRGDGFPWVCDGAIEQYFASSDAHRGYFRWGENAFPDFPYAYFGMGLYGGGSRPMNIVRGSNDGIAWVEYALRNDHRFEDETLPAFWGIKWPDFDPASVRDAGGGEFVFIGSCGDIASGAEERFSDLYEIYVGRDGRTLTRKPRLLLTRGGSGSTDENELAQPALIEYDGQLLCFYQGADADNDNSLHLAIATYSESSAKPDPISRPNHDKYYFHYSMGSRPAWLSVAAGTHSFQATYYAISSNGGLMFHQDTTPDDIGYYEVYATTASGGTSNTAPYCTVAANVNLVQNGVQMNSFSSGTGLASRVANADVEVLSSTMLIGGEMEKNNRFGMRWVVGSDKLMLLSGSGDQVAILDAPSAPSNLTNLRPRFGFATQAGRLESLTFRLGTSGAGVAPTISGVSAYYNYIDFSLSVNCIGDGTGVTIEDNGSPVSGVWSRSDLGVMRFTRGSGEFVGPLTYSVASTDIRSADDLVAIQPLSDVSIAFAHVALTIAHAVMAVSVDSPELVLFQALSVADSVVSMAMDAVVINLAGALAVADVSVPISADSLLLGQQNLLSVSDAAISILIDSLTIGGGAFIAASSAGVAVRDFQHVFVVEV